MHYPVTPDGRYFVVKGRLWRCANPSLAAAERQTLVNRLMDARRAVSKAMRAGTKEQIAQARSAVNETKVALGERGPVWWSDGAPDYNRRLVKNTPYAAWYAKTGDVGMIRSAHEDHGPSRRDELGIDSTVLPPDQRNS